MSLREGRPILRRGLVVQHVPARSHLTHEPELLPLLLLLRIQRSFWKRHRSQAYLDNGAWEAEAEAAGTTSVIIVRG